MALDDTAESTTLAHADDAIAASWREIQARHAGDEAPAEDVEQQEPAETKSERARDATGKFVKAEEKAEVKADDKTEDAQPSEQAAPDANATTAAAAPEGQPTETASVVQSSGGRTFDLMRPPSSWSPAEKAEWPKMSEVARAACLRREIESHEGIAAVKPDVDFARGMKQILEPYRAMVEADGGNLQAATANLFRTASILRNGSPEMKQQALQNIAREFGIPLSAPAEGEVQQYQQPQQFRDPRFDAFLAQHEAEKRARAQAEEQEINTALSSFMNETDAAGAPVHVYFSNLESEIAALIPSFKKPGVPYSQVLKQAYDAAVWANPETRALEQQKQQQTLEAKRREENLRQAAEAKKAASINVPRRGALPAQPAKGSKDEFIARTARELGIIQ